MSVSSVIPLRARISVLGDSITTGNGNVGGAVCWQGPLPGLLDPRFKPSGVAVGAPAYFVRGVAGELIAGMTARITADCAAFVPSYVIVVAGTNDATGGRTQVQANTDTLALIDAIIAIPSLLGMAIGGPVMVGDLWPNGANAFDTGITNVNAGMLQACATRGVRFIDFRARWLANAETLNPSNTLGGSGLMVYNGFDGSLKHPTAAGALWMSTYFAGLV